MKRLSNPTSDYLLGASLTSLHQESRQWIDEIDFWVDEMTFYYNLLSSGRSAGGFPPEEIADLERDLIGIMSEKLGLAKDDIIRHEQTLAAIIGGGDSLDERYRVSHGELRERLGELDTLIRKFKKRVFSFTLKSGLK